MKVVRSFFFLALVAPMAAAAVQDKDSVMLLPAGTVLVLKEGIGVKPHAREVQVYPGPNDAVVSSDKSLYLSLHLEASPRDRELLAGTRWKFAKAEFRNHHYGAFLVGKTEGGTALTWQFADQKRDVTPTIGELKQFFVVELPTPDIIPAY